MLQDSKCADPAAPFFSNSPASESPAPRRSRAAKQVMKQPHRLNDDVYELFMSATLLSMHVRGYENVPNAVKFSIYELERKIRNLNDKVFAAYEPVPNLKAARNRSRR